MTATCETRARPAHLSNPAASIFAVPCRPQAVTWGWRAAPALLVLRDRILGVGFLVAVPRGAGLSGRLIVLSSRPPGHLADHAGSAGRSFPS
jgi:hypothetical protein